MINFKRPSLAEALAPRPAAPEPAPRVLSLTARQERVLRLIVAHLLQVGRPPTLRWLMTATGIAGMQGITSHLVALQKKGWITREKGQYRGIRLAGAKLALSYDDTDAGRRLRALLEAERGNETPQRD